MTRELIAQAEAPDWLHLKPFGYAPGNYMGGCQACKTMMYNVDKRAITCRPCAEKAFAAAMQPAEAVAHIVSSGRAGMPLLQWMSADHSFRAPIGTKLYAHPDPQIAALEADLVTAQQNESIEQGMRKECEAAIAQLAADLAAAQAERDDANKECGYRIKERDEARAALAEAVAEFEQALSVACMLAEISDSKYESLMIYFRKARGAA
jgi:hypothetical protein